MMSPAYSLASLLLVTLSMSFFTLLEQKMLGYAQIRKGPNKTLFQGLAQPLSDGLKLFTKESLLISKSNPYVFRAAPLFTLMLSMLMWALAPLSSPTSFIPYSLLLFLCISSVSAHTIVMAGWASNSKFALIGALRAVAQTISYEITMALCMISLLMLILSYDLSFISTHSLLNLSFMMPPLFIMWCIIILAETNRTPFDFAEGESELVSGFNTEYSGPEFAFIFIGEYLSIMFMSMLTVLMLTQTNYPWQLFLPLKTLLILMYFIQSRATMPRLRYDQLMSITWLSLLPITLVLPLFFILL